MAFDKKMIVTLQPQDIDLDAEELLYQQKCEIDFSVDGYSADIFVVYDEGADVPTYGQKFQIDFPSGYQAILKAKTIPKVDKEVSRSPSVRFFVYKFMTVDPLTFIKNKRVPTTLCPFINTTTGDILRTIIALLDPELDISDIQDGNVITSFNPREFSSFGDMLSSEIMNGYVLRMGNGNQVQGDFEENLVPNSDYQIDKTDYRYTPSRQEIDPPDEILSSVTVIATKLVPAYIVHEFHEVDLRAMPNLGLSFRPFGIEESEPLKLSGNIDLSDTTTYKVTGGVTTSANSLVFSGGTLVLMEGRPYAFPFMTNWTGLRMTSASPEFELGFSDDCAGGGFLLSVTDSDFIGAGIALEQDSILVQNIYGAYAIGKTDGTVAVWGLHLKQDFTVSEEEVIAQITNINTGAKQITLDAPWNIGTDYIRVVRAGVEIGRAHIDAISEDGTVVTVDVNIPGAMVGDDVTRGIQEETTLEIRLLKTVSAGNGFGMPTMTGEGFSVEQMLIQRTGQIHGQLVFQSNENPNSDYPRDLQLDVDVTEFSDGQLSASGSGASITWNSKFSHEKDAWFLLTYVVGLKGEYESTCGSGGAHATVPIDNEQDPVKLQQVADRICALGNRPYPRVNAKMESTEIVGTPLPGDLLPVHLQDDYQIPFQSIPIQSVKMQYRGARVDGTDKEDVLLHTINAGPKTPVERVKQELLKGSGLTKFPLRIATIGGSSVSNCNWNDQTGVFTADVSGGTVFGPHGEELDLSAGIRPADLAGVGNPAIAPVILRLTIHVPGRTQPDIFVIEVVYPPNSIDPTSATYRWFNQERRVEYGWEPAAGGVKYNIFKRKAGATGETDADLEIIDTVTVPGRSWSGAVSKDDRSIWVQTEGVCGKVSSKVKLTATLAQLPAPTTFQLIRKMNHNGRIVVLVSAPPQGDNKGRAIGLKVFARRSTDGTDYDERADFVQGVDGTLIEVLPLKSEDEPAHYKFWFDDFDEDDEVWIGCCWVDQFEDEGVFRPGFDAMHPPFEVGSISTATFFRSPDPDHPETNQASGGTYYDDDDTTNKIEESAVDRIHFGIHTQAFKVVYERSSKTTNDDAGEWPTDESSRFHSPRIELDDADLIAGFKDILMHQAFKWARKKHWTYRPVGIVFIGIGTHEVDDDGEKSIQRDRRFLIGFDGDPTGQPIIPYEIDGYFDKTTFEFKPWLTGLDHGYYKVQRVRARQKPAKIKEKWEPIDDANLWRYIVILSDTNFGTKGPGADAAMVADLDNIMLPQSDGGEGGEGMITLWDQTNSTKNVNAYVQSVENVSQFDWEVGTVYGDFTVDTATTWFVGVLAQNKAGRYSDELSDTDSDTGGGPPGDTGTAIWTDDCLTQRLDPCTDEGETAINLRLRAPLEGGIRIKLNRPQSVKTS